MPSVLRAGPTHSTSQKPLPLSHLPPVTFCKARQCPCYQLNEHRLQSYCCRPKDQNHPTSHASGLLVHSPSPHSSASPAYKKQSEHVIHLHAETQSKGPGPQCAPAGLARHPSTGGRSSRPPSPVAASCQPADAPQGEEGTQEEPALRQDVSLISRSSESSDQGPPAMHVSRRKVELLLPRPPPPSSPSLDHSVHRRRLEILPPAAPSPCFRRKPCRV